MFGTWRKTLRRGWVIASTIYFHGAAKISVWGPTQVVYRKMGLFLQRSSEFKRDSSFFTGRTVYEATLLKLVFSDDWASPRDRNDRDLRYSTGTHRQRLGQT